MNTEHPHKRISLPKIHPTIESVWFTSLIAAAIVVVIAAVHGAFLFANIVQNDTDTIAPDTNMKSVNRSELKEAVAIFEARTTTFESLKQRPPTTPNPAQ